MDLKLAGKNLINNKNLIGLIENNDWKSNFKKWLFEFLNCLRFFRPNELCSLLIFM